MVTGSASTGAHPRSVLTQVRIPGYQPAPGGAYPRGAEGGAAVPREALPGEPRRAPGGRGPPKRGLESCRDLGRGRF